MARRFAEKRSGSGGRRSANSSRGGTPAPALSPSIRGPLPPSQWASWSNDRLLRLRLSDLDLSIEGTWLEDRLGALYRELDERGFIFRPHVWLSEEWFSPLGVPGFAIPFYLAHPRLMRLERSQMLEVEGGTPAEALRIMRHETGHAIQHAYRLGRRRRFQQLIGKPSTRYPTSYRPNPLSRNDVQHLRLWYAQAHPDEDFAETFAVWLRPRFDWRRRYKEWPARRKLEYVDELMAEIAGELPAVTSRARPESLPRLRRTLAQHYAERRAQYSAEAPTIYDRDLRALFGGPDSGGREAASTFLRRNRSRIRPLVAKWTGEYEVTLDTVLENMIRRTRQLRLRVTGPERQILGDFAVLLTVKTMHFLYSEARRHPIAL